MPNGVDKNLVRLAVASAVYRQRFREWPTEARLEPIILWDLAQILDVPNFETLATRLRLRTSERSSISVGGSHGYVRYEDIDLAHSIPGVEQAKRWLGVEVRRDADHW